MASVPCCSNRNPPLSPDSGTVPGALTGEQPELSRRSDPALSSRTHEAEPCSHPHPSRNPSSPCCGADDARLSSPLLTARNPGSGFVRFALFSHPPSRPVPIGSRSPPAPPAPASSSQEQSLSSLRPERGFRFLPCRHAVVRPVFKTGFVISLSTPPPPGFPLFPSKCASEDPLCALRRASSRKAGHSLIPAPGDGGLGLGVARASGRPAEHDGCSMMGAAEGRVFLPRPGARGLWEIHGPK